MHGCLRGAAWMLIGGVYLAAMPARAETPKGTAAAGSAVHTGIYRGHPVTYTIIKGRPIADGDIVLDHVGQLAPARTGTKAGSIQSDALGVAYNSYFWPKVGSVARVPYTITSAAADLNAAISQFNSTFTGVIQLVARTSETDYVDFDFDTNDQSGQCESNVGRVGGKQEVSGSGACTTATILHELGHVVGLYHEQSRIDRNRYLTVSYAAYIKGSLPNFAPVTDNEQTLAPFDYASIMEYGPFVLTRNGKVTIESIPAGMLLSNISGYSAGDIDSIDRLYGAAPQAVTVTSNPVGLSVSVDGAAYTTPHVFNWALDSQHTLAVPGSAQTLSGNAYTYGRWNDDTTASHTITVSRGIGTLAAPRTKPAVTVYSANFIQLIPYTAAVYPSGSGTVGANPAAQAYSGAPGVYYVARQSVTLTAAANTGYGFLEWVNTSSPWSANPKTELAPGAITAYFSSKPISTINTVPAGLYFLLDGQYWKGPQKFASDYFPSWTAGSTHNVSVPTPEYLYSVNSRDVFASWSDGGAVSHDIVVPTRPLNLVARLTPQFAPIAYATPSCAANVTLAPTSPDGFYATGMSVQVTSAPASGWQLTGWLDDLHGTANPQTIVVNDEKLAIANYDTTATALALQTIAPVRARAGTGNLTVTLNGTGFTSSTIVFVNNAYRASTFVSSTSIQLSLTASDLATAGAFPIGVSNFPPGAPCSAYASIPFFVTS